MPADRFGPPRPDGPSPLDGQLSAAREDVVGRIDQPPLHELRARASAHRDRRRRRQTGAFVAVAALLVGGVVAVRPVLGGPDADRIVAGDPGAVTPDSATYAGAGLTMAGLERDIAPADLAGRIGQVAFVDDENGYVLNDCTGDDTCSPALARTADGGRSWQITQVSADFPIDELRAFAEGNVVLGGAESSLVSTDHGRTWTTVADRSGSAPTLPEGDVLCRQKRDGVYRAAALSTGGRSAPLASQPDFDVQWVAPAATETGAWWVAGVDDRGRAAAAVTNDSGETWKTAPFEVDGVRGISVAARGTDVYVLVTGPDAGRLQAVYHSADGGAHFTRTRSVPAQDTTPSAPSSVAGEAVPLPDGRLLLAGAGSRWYVSADHGTTFAPIEEGNLPAVGELHRTSAGYVAENLFNSGWAAFSPDGITWKKLWLN